MYLLECSFEIIKYHSHSSVILQDVEDIHSEKQIISFQNSFL